VNPCSSLPAGTGPRTLPSDPDISLDRPFTGNYLLYLLAQASASASSDFHTLLARHGLSVPTWRILASLHPNGAMSIGQLAGECIQKQPTLTRIVDRLEKDGLVTRVHSGKDRRTVLVSMTKKGQAVSRQFVEQAKAHEARILADYSAEEIDQLKKTLKVLIRRTSGDG